MIKVPELPTIKHDSPFFRNGFLSMSIVGKSGCGKTMFLTSILQGISKSIKTVLIATVVKDAPYHLAIRKHFKDKGYCVGIAHTPSEMRDAVEQIEENKIVTLKKQGLIIFDDFNIGRATGDYWDFTIHAFTKLRNHGWNFIILAQQPTFLPTIVRNCTTCRVLFDCATRSALTNFTKDVSDRLGDKLEYYKGLLEFIRYHPYTYILVQEHPFEISAGTLNKKRTVISPSIVQLPTLEMIQRDLGLSKAGSIDKESRKLQKEAGNDSSRL